MQCDITFGGISFDTSLGGEMATPAHHGMQLKLTAEILIDNGTTNTATLTYTTDKSLDTLADGQSMTQQPAYTPVTSEITNVDTTALPWSSFVRASFGAFSPGMELGFDGDQSTNFNPTQASTDIIFEPPQDFVLTTDLEFYNRNNEPALEYSYEIQGGPSRDNFAQGSVGWKVLTGTAGATIGPGKALIIKNQYFSNSGALAIKWSQFKMNGTILIDDQGLEQTTLTFNTPKDIVNFRPGDVVQTEGTGNAAWNETQAWSNGWTDDSTFFSAGAEAYRGGKFACFSSANDKATTCDIYSGANSRIEWNGNVSGDNITIKFYKERQATLGYVLNGVEQLVTDEVGWESPTTKNLGNGVLTQLFAENNAGTSAGFFSVVVDGKVLVDPTNIYSVVSTDAPASKMTVDGGDWNNGRYWKYYRPRIFDGDVYY